MFENLFMNIVFFKFLAQFWGYFESREMGNVLTFRGQIGKFPLKSWKIEHFSSFSSIFPVLALFFHL